MATPLVLVISRHQAFAEAVRRQLVRLDSIVEIVSPDDFTRLGRPSIATAEVAFVDLDAQTPDGVPLYRSVAGVAKDCQVILVYLFHKMQYILVSLITVYRTCISPFFPPTCRFYPTCSEYSIQAILKYGAFKGSWLAIYRILRCHPFSKGGYDPLK